MDNVLRCSIIFVCVHIFSMKFSMAYINPITNTMYHSKAVRQQQQQQQNHLDSMFSNEEDDGDSLLKVRHTPLSTNFADYDPDNYFYGGEDLDPDENTQSTEDEYEDDDYKMTVDKRNRHVPRQGKRTDRLVDLCPISEGSYQVKDEWKQQGYKLRFPYKELSCNHTTTHKGYDRQYNRICYSLGRTFEYGHGTHCFQRYTMKEIKVKTVSTTDDKDDDSYIETHFRYGCTCGWATNELGSIRDYHYDKILNLCSEMRDKV